MMLWIVLPLLGALIGWWTNHLALWMLFHPQREVRFLGISWQGAIPRRRDVLADRLASAIEDHLLTVEDRRTLLDSIRIDQHLDRIVTQVLQQQVPTTIFRQMPLSAGFRERIIDVLRSNILRRMPKKLSEIDERIPGQVIDELDLGGHIRKRLLELPVEDLESLIRRTAHREFVAIELAGAVLGLLIGLIQAAVVTLMEYLALGG